MRQELRDAVEAGGDDPDGSDMVDEIFDATINSVEYDDDVD